MMCCLNYTSQHQTQFINQFGNVSETFLFHSKYKKEIFCYVSQISNNIYLHTRIDTRNSITSYQNGEECFCGDYLTKSYKKSDSECKMACKGKRAQACGGTWRVLIYRNPYYRCKLFSQPTQELNILNFCTLTIF